MGSVSEVRDHRKVLFQPTPSSDLKQENVYTGEVRLKVHFKLILDKQYGTLSPVASQWPGRHSLQFR